MKSKGKNGKGAVKRAVRRGVHAHERKMHPGKPMTKINGKRDNGC